jgi:hypothetical protein
MTMHNISNDDNDVMETATAMIDLHLVDRHHPTIGMMTEMREITDLDHDLGTMMHVVHHRDLIVEQPQEGLGDQGHRSNRGEEKDVTIDSILGWEMSTIPDHRSGIVEVVVEAVIDVITMMKAIEESAILVEATDQTILVMSMSFEVNLLLLQNENHGSHQRKIQQRHHRAMESKLNIDEDWMHGITTFRLSHRRRRHHRRLSRRHHQLTNHYRTWTSIQHKPIEYQSTTCFLPQTLPPRNDKYRIFK